MTPGESREPLRVLIADDHAPTRDDVRRALEADRRFSVCAEAADAAEAVQAALRTRPDIAVLDVHMPGSGVAAAWELAARLPTTTIVMLTVSDDDGDLMAALRAGAVGYLLKDMDFGRLPPALHDAAEGRAAVPRRLLANVIDRVRDCEPRFRSTSVLEDGPHLTSREWQVLELLARGLSTREIANRLTLTSGGVRAHIAFLVRKLGVASRQEAIALFSSRSQT
ncbi:MAG TPA: response regulator transcription factor [Gaiellaceae bacterium]